MSTVNPPPVFSVPEWRYSAENVVFSACVCVCAGYFPPPLNPLQMGVCGVGSGEGAGFGGGAIRDLPSGAQESAAMQD